MNNLRILQLAENLQFGGLETHLLSLCKEFIKLGHRPYLFSMAMGIEFAEELQQLGIEYLIDPTGQKAEDFITSHNIQVLHGHPAATVPLAASLGERLKLPVVVTYHGLYGWGWQVHKSIASFICISQEIADKLIQADPHHFPKVTVIPNGIDTDQFKLLSPLGNGRKILFLGRLDPDKYFTIKMVIDNLSEITDTELLIAGSGAFYDRLMAEVPSWVKCLGFIRDVPPVINQADLVIGTGRGIREAMACGRPSIAMDACGYDGLVTPGNIAALEYQNFSGRSGRSLTREPLLRDLKLIRESLETRDRLSSWSMKHARHHYAITPLALKHLLIYSELMKSPKKSKRKKGST